MSTSDRAIPRSTSKPLTYNLPTPVSTSNYSYVTSTVLHLWSIFASSLMSDKSLQNVSGLLGILQNIAGGCGYPPIYFSLASVRTAVDYVKVLKDNAVVATKLTEHLVDIDARLATAQTAYTGGEIKVITNNLRSTLKSVHDPLTLIADRGLLKAIFHSFTDSQTLGDQIEKIDNALQIFQVSATLAFRVREDDTRQTRLQENLSRMKNICDTLQAYQLSLRA